MPTLISLADWAFRAVLRLHPRAFRDTYADEMRFVFQALIADAARSGPLRLYVTVGRELLGLTASLARERAAQLGSAPVRLRVVRAALSAAAVTLFLLATTFYVLLDMAYAISLNGWVLALVAGVGGAIFLAVRAVAPTRLHTALLVLFLALTLGLPAVELNSRKPFVRALSRVTPGMGAAEVDQIMHGYMRGQTVEGGRGSLVFRHTDEGWGNADLGLVTLEGDRVVEVRFLPD